MNWQQYNNSNTSQDQQKSQMIQMPLYQQQQQYNIQQQQQQYMHQPQEYFNQHQQYAHHQQQTLNLSQAQYQQHQYQVQPYNRQIIPYYNNPSPIIYQNQQPNQQQLLILSQPSYPQQCVSNNYPHPYINTSLHYNNNFSSVSNINNSPQSYSSQYSIQQAQGFPSQSFIQQQNQISPKKYEENELAQNQISLPQVIAINKITDKVAREGNSDNQICSFNHQQQEQTNTVIIIKIEGDQPNSEKLIDLTQKQISKAASSSDQLLKSQVSIADSENETINSNDNQSLNKRTRCLYEPLFRIISPKIPLKKKSYKKNLIKYLVSYQKGSEQENKQTSMIIDLILGNNKQQLTKYITTMFQSCKMAQNKKEDIQAHQYIADRICQCFLRKQQKLNK